MKLPESLVKTKLRLLGLITEQGKAVSFNKFKEYADAHLYGSKSNKIYIVYVGLSKENLFAFYPPRTNKAESLKIAYQYYVDTVETEMMQEYLDGNVKWGNCGYPLSYSGLRAIL